LASKVLGVVKGVKSNFFSRLLYHKIKAFIYYLPINSKLFKQKKGSIKEKKKLLVKKEQLFDLKDYENDIKLILCNDAVIFNKFLRAYQ
jgi:hypothetical protein